MIPGMPNIPGLDLVPTNVTDAAISFGGAFATNVIFGKQWGIYSEFGVPILLADTVYSVKYQASSNVAQAPVERGTFASYNKVSDPYKATVVLARGGSNAALRGAFIAQLDALVKSTALFHVVTPEYVHRNASITGYDYARDPQSGASMIVANIHLEEIREVNVLYETIETRNPADLPVKASGEVQAQGVDESLLSRFVGGEGEGTVLDRVKGALGALGGFF